jgi:hypothetical protein
MSSGAFSPPGEGNSGKRLILILPAFGGLIPPTTLEKGVVCVLLATAPAGLTLPAGAAGLSDITSFLFCVWG